MTLLLMMTCDVATARNCFDTISKSHSTHAERWILLVNQRLRIDLIGHGLCEGRCSRDRADSRNCSSYSIRPNVRAVDVDANDKLMLTLA